MSEMRFGQRQLPSSRLTDAHQISRPRESDRRTAPRAINAAATEVRHYCDRGATLLRQRCDITATEVRHRAITLSYRVELFWVVGRGAMPFEQPILLD